MTANPTPPKIEAIHCQACGSTDRQDLAGDDGYTACCNERKVYQGCNTGDCYHGEWDAHYAN